MARHRLTPALLLGLTALLCSILAPVARLRAFEDGPVRGVPGNHSPPPSAPVFADTGPLGELLAAIPNRPAYRDFVTFGDVSAWYDATGYPRAASQADVEKLPHWEWYETVTILPNQTAPPDAIGYEPFPMADMQSTYGFSLFDATQMASAGQPITNVAVIRVMVPPAQIDETLSAHGYTSETIDGGLLYQVGDTSGLDPLVEIYMEDKTSLNHIAVIGGGDGKPTTLFAGAELAPVQDALAAFAGEDESLADNPVFRAAAEALVHPQIAADRGRLVGTIFMAPPETDGGGESGPGAATGPKVLPAWQVGALSTYRDGEDAFLTALLVYPRGSDAKAASAVLADRMEHYVSAASGASMQGDWSLEELGSLKVDGYPVAFVTMRRGAAVDNRVAWIEMVKTDDVGFMKPGLP